MPLLLASPQQHLVEVKANKRTIKSQKEGSKRERRKEEEFDEEGPSVRIRR
jgi:hypothetical protein